MFGEFATASASCSSVYFCGPLGIEPRGYPEGMTLSAAASINRLSVPTPGPIRVRTYPGSDRLARAWNLRSSSGVGTGEARSPSTGVDFG